MPRRRKEECCYEDYNMEGGDIFKDIKKGFNKKIAKPIEKKIIKPASKKFFKPLEKGLQTAGIELGKFTNEELLPAVVSTGIPLAGTALGTLGAMYGIPPEITSSLTENLLQEYIPKQYQSKNKYVGLLGDALNMGLSGNPDPRSMMDFGSKLTGAVSSDIFGKNKIKNPVPTSEYYNPDEPYADLMMQLLSGYPTSQTSQYKSSQEPEQQSIQPQTIDYNSMTDAIYKTGELGEGSDSINITSPPYQQKEGSMTGLLGGGIKKRRGRPKKKVEESSSESEEEEPKRRRPKKGKGIDYDSSSDEDEIKTYGQMLKHLVSHIKDPKEPIDPKDYKQAIQLIKRIKSKKA